MRSVFIFQNAPAPYRSPLFKKLNKTFNLTVVYGTKGAGDRFWSTTDEEYNFKILNGFNIKLNNKILTFARGLKKYLKQNEFDVYIINDDLRCILSNLSIIRSIKKRKKPIILWCGTVDTPYRWNVMLPKSFRPLYDCYFKYLSFHVSVYLAYGPKTVDFFNERFKIPRNKFIWGTQAATLELEAESHEKIKSSSKVTFLFLGYLDPGKGVKDLIKAIQLLDREDFRLVIAGKGSEEKTLKELAKNNSQVQFVGYIEGEEKKKCYLEADVFVSPTYHDSWANTINEACFFGLPIITTEAEGAEGTMAIDSYNAVKVPSGDIEKLKDALEYFLNKKENIQKMGKRSKELASKFNLDWAADNFLKIISIAQGT